MKPYLTEDEQFKPILNNEEIERIKDPELRQLRQAFWNKKTDAFLDVANIQDNQLGNVSDQIQLQEEKAIKEYKLRHSIR